MAENFYFVKNLASFDTLRKTKKPKNEEICSNCGGKIEQEIFGWGSEGKYKCSKCGKELNKLSSVGFGNVK